MLVGVLESGVYGGDPPVLERSGQYRASAELDELLPVVDVWCRIGDALTILDIEICLNTRGALVVFSIVDLDDLEVDTSGSRPVFL